MDIINIILHLDQYLALWSLMLGPWLYVLVFAIVFCETGLIVTPFLPGDSLLFALGALTVATSGELNIFYLSAGITTAAFLGDNVNYFFGKFIGPKVFSKENSKLFNKKHLTKTHAFYEKYGSKAVIIARFVPIVRTFVPFVAGIARMEYKKYISFSIAGALLWVNIFLFAGHYFGNIPAVKRNFHVVIVAVILISVMPMFIEWYRHRKSQAVS